MGRPKVVSLVRLDVDLFQRVQGNALSLLAEWLNAQAISSRSNCYATHFVIIRSPEDEVLWWVQGKALS